MDIAAMSAVLSQGKVQQQVSLSVMKMAMGVQTKQGDLISSLAGQTAPSAQLYLGSNLDTLA